MCQHVEDRVWLALEPEVISSLDVPRNVESLGLASIRNHAVVVRTRDRPGLVPEKPREEMIPRVEPVVRLGRITLEQFLELLVGLTDIGRKGKFILTVRAEPTAAVVAFKDICRCRRAQEVAPDIQDLLQHPVHIRVEKDGEPARCTHGPVEQRIERKAHQSHALRLVIPRRRGADEVVHDLEHMDVVTDLRMMATTRIVVVRLLVRDLLEHGREQHPHPRVVLDQLLELLEHRVQLLIRVPIDLRDNSS